MRGYLPGDEAVWHAANFGASFLIITVLFAMIFRVLPDTYIAWRDVSVGAALTALLFTLGKFLIGLYLGKTAVGSTYGAAGSLIIILLWTFYSAQILFFGIFVIAALLFLFSHSSRAVELAWDASPDSDIITYHLYYGDSVGTPGSVLTFFPWAGLRRGRPGNGQVYATAFSVSIPFRVHPNAAPLKHVHRHERGHRSVPSAFIRTRPH